MAARKAAPARFVRQYTNWAGNVFRTYQAPDGLRADIRIRTGRQGRIEYTNAEAKAEAIRQLARLRRGGR